MSTDGPDLFVVGLDGAPWHLMSEWIEEGVLPTIAEVASGGSYGPLESTIPPVTVPAWPTFATGMNPGKHGIYNFVEQGDDLSLVPGDVVDLHDTDHPYLWEELNARGDRTVVMNFPLVYPPLEVDGAFVSGPGAPTDADDRAYPPEYNRILEAHDHSPGDQLYLDTEKERAARETEAAIHAEFDVFEEILERESPDFAFCLLKETDEFQHAAFDRTDLVKSLYEAVDDRLADLRAEYPSASFLLMSDHGFEALPDWEFRINAWLHEAGYVEFDPVRRTILNPWVLGVGRPVIGKAIKIVDRDKRKEGDADRESRDTGGGAVSSVLTKAGNWLLGGLGDTPVTGNIHGVFLEDRGIRPGLMADLRGLETPDGTPVYEMVAPAEAVYHGDRLDDAPDVVCLPGENVRVSPYPLRGVFGDPVAPHIAGEHQTDRQGFFAFDGPLATGAGPTEGFGLVDVMPTVLHAMGHPVPEALDGEARTDLVDREGSVTRDRSVEVDRVSRTDAGDDELKDHLRDLGYI